MATNTTINYPLLGLFRAWLVSGSTETEITAELLTFSTHRGIVRDGPSRNGDAGTCTLTFREVPAKFWSPPRFRRGQTIELRGPQNSSDTLRPLFTGTVDTVDMVPDDSDDAPRNARIVTVALSDNWNRYTATKMHDADWKDWVGDDTGFIITIPNTNYVLEPGFANWTLMIDKVLAHAPAGLRTAIYKTTQALFYQL